VRSGPGRWSWPHTVQYRLARRAWAGTSVGLDPVFWMGGGETDADGQHCLRADSAVFEGEGVQLGQQDEEFFPACFELISGRCDSDARRRGSG